MRLPRALMPVGPLSAVYASRYPPLAANRSNRLLPVSETQMSPEAATATPVGLLNWPAPDPRAPNFERYFPLALNCWTRLFPVSATQTFPEASTLTPLGWLS